MATPELVLTPLLGDRLSKAAAPLGRSKHCGRWTWGQRRSGGERGREGGTKEKARWWMQREERNAQKKNGRENR